MITLPDNAAAFAALIMGLIAFIGMLLPPVRHWYESLPSEYQTAVKGVLALVVGAGLVSYQCYTSSCTPDTALDYFLRIVVVAIIGLSSASAVTAASAFLAERKARKPLK